jgi:hypothetical protein
MSAFDPKQTLRLPVGDFSFDPGGCDTAPIKASHRIGRDLIFRCGVPLKKKCKTKEDSSWQKPLRLKHLETEPLPKK